MSFEYEKRIAKQMLEDLHAYGITWDIVEQEGFDDIYRFMQDYDIYDKYGDSVAYENFMELLKENAGNYIDFTDDDFREYLKLALDYNDYQRFKDIEEDEGWNPIKLPDTEEEFYNLLETDSDFYDNVWRIILDSVLHDWPELGICIFHEESFYDYIEDNL